jgi:hypothetical protein
MASPITRITELFKRAIGREEPAPAPAPVAPEPEPVTKPVS